MRNALSLELPLFLALIASLCPSTPSVMQEDPGKLFMEKRDLVSCYDDQGKARGSKTSESPVLESPDGKSRANVTVKTVYDSEAEKAPQGSHRIECFNVSQLFVGHPKNGPPSLVFTAAPLPETNEAGNTIELADWSKDGRFLVATYLKWAYFSDWYHFDLLVYDSQTNQTMQPNVESMFSQRAGKQCSIEVRARGFAEDGVTPVIEAWDAPEEESCIGQASLWRVNLKENVVSPVPKGFQMQRYGRVSQ